MAGRLFEKAVGIDLAGVCGKNTSCVKVERKDGELVASMLAHNVLCQGRKGKNAAEPILAADSRAIRTWVDEKYGISIDCPIDLQGLPAPAELQYLWQLWKRPIDQLVGGMAPLADRLGSVVARCLATLHQCNLYRELGTKIFETYPKAILARKGFARREIKKDWTVLLTTDGPQVITCRGKNGQAIIDELQRLKVVCGGEHAVRLTDHQLDAILCAIPLLSDNPATRDLLTAELHAAYPALQSDAPQGYSLDDSNIWWERIIVSGPVLPPRPGCGVRDGGAPPRGPNVLYICDSGGVHTAHNEWLAAYVGGQQVFLITQDELAQHITLTPAAAPGMWRADPTTTELFRARGGQGRLSGNGNNCKPIKVMIVQRA